MRTIPALALLLSSVALAAPACAQERAGVGSGILPAEKPNSALRPIVFAASAPAGASLVLPVSAVADIAKAAAGLPAGTVAAIGGTAG